ncbi:peptidase S8/S53 domain-containing protein [Xylogone sp. PMI_703]|nr:peptidase S8/S53 domain-containing protein [Xylogone sp. PMI_703]
MLVKSATLVLALVAVVQSAAVPNTHVVHEKRDSAPKSWVKRDKLHPKALLPMRIGLKQQSLDRGYEFLMDVSHPSSSNYGKHWTSDEVIAMFAPDDKTVETVRQWLIEFGIAPERITHTDNRGWLAFDATTEEAEGLLHTEFYGYEHKTTGHVSAACDSYHLPKHIQEHVDFITPGIKLLAPVKRGHRKRGFGMTKAKSSHGAALPPKFKPTDDSNLASIVNQLETCDQTITPACIKALYKVPPATKAHPSNSLGIFEEGDFYLQEDLDLFFANFTPYIKKGTHPTPAFIDGAQAPTTDVEEAGGESDLDFELAYPLIYPQKITLYQTDDLFYATGSVATTTGGFNTFLDAIDGSYCTYSAFGETGNDPNLDPVYPDPNPGGYKGKTMCGVYKPTNVISVSYGGQEADLPAYYQQRQCNEFLKLGLQGHSILYASGDDGVAGPPGDDSDNGCLGPDATVFSPAWPNSCPWLTNVGATKVYPGHTVFEPESAVVDPAGHPYRDAFSSGGGFSNIYPIPSYQEAAVAEFFQKHNPPYPHYSGGQNLGKNGGVYNRVGRGYPDVAANGDNIATYNAAEFGLSGGTSASTPIFASIVNLINEERLAIGKKPVGFLNPVLYANPGVLNDITNGTNPGCGTVGFSAVKGWDPVTGLGTPNYPKMLSLFLSLP